MSSLSEGEHTLKVTFNDGKEATTKFTISKTNSKELSEESNNSSNTGNPKTGDNINVWISLMIISSLGII